MIPRALLAVTVVVLSGCAITQNVTPSGLDQRSQELCLVRNSEVVQDAFHDVYAGVLEKKGFKVRSLPDKSPTTSTEPKLTELVDLLFPKLKAYLRAHPEALRTAA